MVQEDAINIPFRDNSFDIVGLFDLIEHFQDDTKLLKETVRVVKKGGGINFLSLSKIHLSHKLNLS